MTLVGINHGWTSKNLSIMLKTLKLLQLSRVNFFDALWRDVNDWLPSIFCTLKIHDFLNFSVIKFLKLSWHFQCFYWTPKGIFWWHSIKFSLSNHIQFDLVIMRQTFLISFHSIFSFEKFSDVFHHVWL